MIKVMCIGTKRDTHNKILGYYLKDKNKFKRYIGKSKLKELIKSGQMQVLNLTLTSDNRLVFKEGKEKVTTVNTKTENIHKKSLKEIVLAQGDKGYEYKGLVYR